MKQITLALWITLTSFTFAHADDSCSTENLKSVVFNAIYQDSCETKKFRRADSDSVDKLANDRLSSLCLDSDLWTYITTHIPQSCPRHDINSKQAVGTVAANLIWSLQPEDQTVANLTKIVIGFAQGQEVSTTSTVLVGGN